MSGDLADSLSEHGAGGGITGWWAFLEWVQALHDAVRTPIGQSRFGGARRGAEC